MGNAGESEGSAASDPTTQGAEGTVSATSGAASTTSGAESATFDSQSETGIGPDGTDDATTGDDPPEQCLAPDPAVDASFSIDIHHWPGAGEEPIEYDVNCEVLDMHGFPADTIEPTLLCSVDGSPQTVDIVMANPQLADPNGGGDLIPALEVGMPIRLHYWGVLNFGGLIGGGPVRSHAVLEEFSLHAANTESPFLLAAGSKSVALTPSVYEPIIVTGDREFCPTADPDADRPMLLTFTDEAPGAVITLIGGHRGLLDPAGLGEEGMAIDVEEATAIFVPTHSDATYHVLVRRMRSAGD